MSHASFEAFEDDGSGVRIGVDFDIFDTDEGFVVAFPVDVLGVAGKSEADGIMWLQPDAADKMADEIKRCAALARENQARVKP